MFPRVEVVRNGLDQVFCVNDMRCHRNNDVVMGCHGEAVPATFVSARWELASNAASNPFASPGDHPLTCRRVMTAVDVLSILDLLRRADIEFWIGGGWGIDALVGEQTRQHRDLDPMHRDGQEPAVVAALADVGFVESLNWRPVRFVVTDPRGRDIDLLRGTGVARSSQGEACLFVGLRSARPCVARSGASRV